MGWLRSTGPQPPWDPTFCSNRCIQEGAAVKQKPRCVLRESKSARLVADWLTSGQARVLYVSTVRPRESGVVSLKPECDRVDVLEGVAHSKFRGCSSAGRALQSHCRGQGFDPPQLHHHQVESGTLLARVVTCPPPFGRTESSNDGERGRLPGLASGWFAGRPHNPHGSWGVSLFGRVAPAA